MVKNVSRNESALETRLKLIEGRLTLMMGRRVKTNVATFGSDLEVPAV
jgi:hypothetical protein